MVQLTSKFTTRVVFSHVLFDFIRGSGALATENTYALHIKYRKLNLLEYGVDKKARTGFFKPQSKSLFVCAMKCMTRLLASIYHELMVTQEHYYSMCLYTRVLLACGTCILFLVHT